MRIALLTCGTRGDTQPMTVLGAALQAQGHEVVVAASPNTLDLPRRCGLPVQALGPDSQALMDSEAGQRWLAAGDVRTFTKEIGALSSASFEQTVTEADAACRGADVIVAGPLAEDLAASVATLAGVPLVTLHSFPFRASRAVAHPLVTTRRLPGPLRAASGWVFEQVWWREMRKDVDVHRAAVGLPPSGGPLGRSRPAGSVELQVYDPALVPDLGWGPDRPLTGFLTISAELRAALGESEPDADLDAWLDAGPPPVFFGFGSMPVRDPAATLAVLREVLRATGQRGLISSGWAGLADDVDDDDVRGVRAVDHDRLFPRCSAVVHHGGAGTLAAGLGAGRPTVVCSVFADQPFWGSRVQAAGVGDALAFRDLSPRRLEEALRVALSDPCRERAADLARRMRPGADATADAAARVLAAA